MHCHKTLILVFSFLLCQVCCLLDASYLSYTLKMGLFSFICSWSLLCAMQGINCSVIESFVSGRFDDCTKDERERLSNDINSLQVCIAHPSLHRALSTCVFFLCYLMSIMGTDKWQTKPWKELSSCIWAPKDLGPHTLLYLRLSIHGRGPLIQSLSTKRILVSAVQTSSYYTHHQSQLTNAIMHEMCCFVPRKWNCSRWGFWVLW